MNRKKSSTVSALLAVLLSVALLGGCGSSTNDGVPASGAATSATTVGINVCTGCHLPTTADWLTSKHANAAGGDLNSTGSPTSGGNYTVPACGRCHDPNGDSARLTAGYTGNFPRPVVGCEACHGGGSLHYGAGPISLLSGTYDPTAMYTIGAATVSGQFLMCTNCHELLDTAGTGTNPAPAHSATPPVGPLNYITDTHFATPGSWLNPDYKMNTNLTGYAMNFADERVCTTCHNPHKPASQSREWAQSAHADKNPVNLNSAIPPAKPTGYFSGAWAHYNWSCDGTNGLGCGPTDTATSSTKPPASNRRACQRCHTTSGFVAYADALRSGNSQRASDINAGLISLVTYTSAFTPEMLKCNGCHTDTRGTLRNPGPITANYDYAAGGVKASHTYPDLAGSNVCMTCHVGRESGDTIKGLQDAALVSAGTTSTDFSNQSFINSHYLSAGGQVFTVTGYGFTGRLYNNINEYLHDKIGTPAAPNTGSNGPCIGCHMSRPNKNGNHLFLPVTRSATTIGKVTGIASEVCIKCHTTSLTDILNMVNEEKDQYLGALEGLKDQLAARGYYFFPYSPYFFISNTYNTSYVESGACNQNLPIKNWQTGGTTATFTWNANKFSCDSTAGTPGAPGTGTNNIGAAFNFNLLEHDPGAYVHNRMYVKRLIYDSIDWLDDGFMNFSVGTTLCSECALTCTGSGVDAGTWCPEAMTYLLPGGKPLGIDMEAERP